MLQSAQAAQQPTYLTLPWTSCKAKLIRTFADYRAYIKVEWLKCKWLCIFSFFCVLFHECHLLLSSSSICFHGAKNQLTLLL